MGPLLSRLIHHVLKINLIEAIDLEIIRFKPSTHYVYVNKPECATERVDENFWNIIFTTSLLYVFYNSKIVTLTKPVVERTEVSPLIEDNIEDSHDENHYVEGAPSSHRREFSFVVDNHEGEED